MSGQTEEAPVAVSEQLRAIAALSALVTAFPALPSDILSIRTVVPPTGAPTQPRCGWLQRICSPRGSTRRAWRW
jgi:hypothetical protein